MTELAPPFPISLPVVSKHLKVLERSALLERNGWAGVALPEDGRERPLRLTPAGRRKLEGAYPAWKAAQELAGRGFGQHPGWPVTNRTPAVGRAPLRR